MPGHPLTVAVGVAAAGLAAVAILGGQLSATANTNSGPLSCADDSVDVHHIDYDENASGSPIEPVAALEDYLHWRKLDIASEFQPIAVYADTAYFGATDAEGGRVAVATLNRYGVSWRLSQFMACAVVVARGAVE